MRYLIITPHPLARPPPSSTFPPPYTKQFDKVAIPATISYKFEEARCDKLPKLLPSLFPPVPPEEEKKRFEALHHKYAKPLFDVYMSLGGFYYKNGQKIGENGCFV